MNDPLVDLKNILKQSSNSINYIKQSLIISNILQNLLIKLKHDQNMNSYGVFFLNNNGIFILFRLLKISSKFKNYFYDINIQNKLIRNKSFFDELKKIEHSILLCLKHVLQTNPFEQFVICESDYYLGTLYILIWESETSEQIILLDIFALLCTANVNRVLDTLSWYCDQSECANRFRGIIHLINSTSNRCITCSLNLINQILVNIDLNERFEIQRELNDAGLTSEMLKNLLTISGDDVMKDKIEEYISLNVYLNSNDFKKQTEKIFVTSDTLEGGNTNLNRNEIKIVKPTLNVFKSHSQDNVHRNEILEKSNTIMGAVEELTKNDPLEDLNVKSYDEELVSTSIVFCKPSCVGKIKDSFVDQSQSKPFNQFKACLPSNIQWISPQTKVDPSHCQVNLPRSKYFCYLKENIDSFGNEPKSIRKSLGKFFKLNKKTTDSVYAVHSFNKRSDCPETTFDDQMCKDNNNCYSSENDSVKSLSLPRAFRSNFILRRNIDMHFSQSHLYDNRP